jgi:hypothetical protein
VIQVREVRGVAPYTVLSADIDNLRGEVRFIVLTLGEGGGEALLELVIEAVGSSGESTVITLKPEMALDHDGRIVNLKTDPLEIRIGSPVALQLHAVAATPNPAAGKTVEFSAQGEGIRGIKVEVYDLAGRRVFASQEVVGNRLGWQMRDDRGQEVANGVYLYAIAVHGFNGEVVRSEVQKLVILR